MAKTLYRDPANGKLGGVCAGLAEYFDMEIWLVRILVVSAFLLGGGFFIIVAYVAAMLILEKCRLTGKRKSFSSVSTR